MDERIKERIAFALKCDVSKVPEDPQELDKALKERRAKLKKEKKHG